MNSCPTNYEYISEGEGNDISCKLLEGSEGEGIIQDFILSSGPDNSSCNTDTDIEKNGCFNKFPPIIGLVWIPSWFNLF